MAMVGWRQQCDSAESGNYPQGGLQPPIIFPMNSLIGIAIFLLILWVVLRLALAITSGLLHLVWIVALVMFVFWIVGHLRGSGA